MPRIKLAALLIGAVLLLLFPALALLSASTPGQRPLCRVEAWYTPLSWPAWADPDVRLRRITVQLRPGCPPGGRAEIRFYNAASGRSLPERGTYTLTPVRPRKTLPVTPGSGVMPAWRVYWHAASGVPYLVPFPGDSP